MMTLDTFSPPPVEPAQAPMNIRIKSTVLEAVGQRSKSVVAKPVVVITDATWKSDLLKASNNDVKKPQAFAIIIRVETRITAK